MTIDDKAIKAYEENSKLAKKYQTSDSAWLDWYAKGYAQAKKDLKEENGDIRVYLNPNFYGNRKYYFTKNDSHCLCIEYNPKYDFGEGSPSGALLQNIEIHTNNQFNFDGNHQEIKLDEVPECIRELLSYLK